MGIRLRALIMVGVHITERIRAGLCPTLSAFDQILFVSRVNLLVTSVTLRVELIR